MPLRLISKSEVSTQDLLWKFYLCLAILLFLSKIYHAILNSTHNPFVFSTDHTGVTPLIEAIKNGHVEVVKALLDKGSLMRLTLTSFLIDL